jgi:excisionase family DNA binding protein
MESINEAHPARHVTPYSAGDAFSEVIARAVEDGVRKALHVYDATNRRLFTVKEAAVYLALSPREVYNMIAAKELAGVKHGRRTMVDKRDLDSWIEQNKDARER